MNLPQKILLVILSFLILGKAYTQNYQKKDSSTAFSKKNYKNDIRGFLLLNATIAYDRALSDKFSVGIEGLVSSFPGYAGSLLGRFYFRSFYRSGFFIEEKVTYGFYNPIVYDSVSNDNPDRTLSFFGAHPANLNYFGNTISTGYRVYGKRLFVEFLAGLRFGELKSGKTDRYADWQKNGLGFFNPDPSPSSVFNSIIGPGFPLHLNIRVGFRF